MSLNAIFQWIYCLDFHKALILLAISTALFCIVRSVFSQCRLWKPALFVMLIGWASIVIIQTVLRRSPDTAMEPFWLPFQSYFDALKADGQKELLRSNFMNAVLFYPAGLFAGSMLPEKWKTASKLSVILLGFTVFSTAIEYIQYRCSLGLAQTDDVIHNALGALLGAAAVLIIPATFRKKREKEPQK